MRHLTVDETVDLVVKLADATREFARREGEWLQDIQKRHEGIERQRASTGEAEETRLAQALSEEEARHQNERQRLEERRAKRSERIGKALNSSRKSVQARIDETIGRQKYKLQKAQLDANRARDQGVANAKKRYSEFTQSLEQNRDAFMDLEDRAYRSFSGNRRFRRWLVKPPSNPAPDDSPSEDGLLQNLESMREETEQKSGKFRRMLLPGLFRFFPLYLQLALALAAGAAVIPAVPYFNWNVEPIPAAAGTAVALLVLVLLLYQLALYQGRRMAADIATLLESGRQWHDAALTRAQARRHGDIERLEAEFAQSNREFSEGWNGVEAEEAEIKKSWPERIQAKSARVTERHERRLQAQLAALEKSHAEAAARLKEESEQRKRESGRQISERSSGAGEAMEQGWLELSKEWKARIEPLSGEVEAAARLANEETPRWTAGHWKEWRPPERSKKASRLGWLDVNLPKLAGSAPRDPRLALPNDGVFSLPLWLVYPNRGSLLIETKESGAALASAVINNMIFRLLANSSAGKANFTIIDPVKLGQNFSGVMHLADFEENLINRRIWTQTSQIEERLGDLTEHMEKVIQMYLRNDYQSIEEYNEQAGNIAEKFHFLVIADFPTNFSDTALKRLLHIASSGARCGVFTLIHWDHRYSAAADFIPSVLRESSVCFTANRDGLALTDFNKPGVHVKPDSPPDPDAATEFLHRVGETSRGSQRVEVPFAHVAPADPELWSLDTTEELRVPIGRSGATKLQYLSLGKGTRQHALIAGKTGSGKSTLFHVIITNLALWCDPDQVEFYLVDFKKGVEFKPYAVEKLPHARVVAIESDREFGLSVLRRVDAELRKRGDLFRQLGVQDVAGYKRAGGAEPMPRSLLIIDEFQEFFVEDDRILQESSVLLDRIVRQGRAFGIHVALGSQTLGGAYTLARATIGQMVVRVALQCNEADSYLILDENNAAARLLSRPGEGIYNDSAGAVEGNSPFQAVWLPEEERKEALIQVRERADKEGVKRPGPVVFEGNAPADVRDNEFLNALREGRPIPEAPGARIWLGAPNAIKGPTEVRFERRTGAHLLFVGQQEETTLSLMAIGLVALAAQYPNDGAELILLDHGSPGTPQRDFIEGLASKLTGKMNLARTGDIEDLMGRLSQELHRRAESESEAAPEIFLFIRGIENFTKLRQEDDFNFSLDDSEPSAQPGAQLTKLVSEGGALGIHVIVSVDTYNNALRFLGRKALGEFEMRVLFQMSAGDSANLCDDPRASALGLHAALFYNQQEGYMEKFRPYAMPGEEWFAGQAIR